MFYRTRELNTGGSMVQISKDNNVWQDYVLEVVTIEGRESNFQVFEEVEYYVDLFDTFVKVSDYKVLNEPVKEKTIKEEVAELKLKITELEAIINTLNINLIAKV